MEETFTHSGKTTELDKTWQEFELAISKIAKLAKSNISFSDFSSQLLQQAVPMLSAVGGAVWEVDSSGLPRAVAELIVEDSADISGPTAKSKRAHFVLQSLSQKEVTVTQDDKKESKGNSLLYILGPLTDESQKAFGILEVIQRPNANAATLQGTRRLVSILSELASDFLRRREMCRLRRSRNESKQFESFVYKIHKKLNTIEVAYLLANEGRNYADCDRLSVILRQGNRYRVVAVSGVDSVNRRSNAIKALEKFAKSVGQAREPLLFDGHTDDLPPQLEKNLIQFLEDSHSKSLFLVPVKIDYVEKDSLKGVDSPYRLIGVLAAEQFSEPLSVTGRNRVNLLAKHGAAALGNAMAYDRLPTLPFARHHAKWSVGRERKIWKSILLAAAAIALWGLLRTPVDFNISVRGELQPLHRREIFTPHDGEIVSLCVQHGDQVAQGDVLIAMHSPELELELQRVEGEQQTTQQRLLAVQSSLLQYTPSENRSSSSQTTLAGEIEELKQQIQNQQRQKALLSEQQEKLVVRSPIAGSVVTWDPGQLLTGRPVQRGQALLSVADVKGPWIAEIEIPDDRIGYVMESKESEGFYRHVSFELARSKGEVYQGKLKSIADRIEDAEENRPVLRAILELDSPAIDHAQPGSTIYAKIHCGQRALWRVWLQDLYHAIKTWIYF